MEGGSDLWTAADHGHKQNAQLVQRLYHTGAEAKTGLIFGQQLMVDESRTPGWYKGSIMQGPEPKLVCTDVMMHIVCITDSPFTRYKLHACTLGGNMHKDLQS